MANDPPSGDMALAPLVAPFVPVHGDSVRRAVVAVAELGFRTVQLDATLAGMRPRELDQRARRDVLAMLVRANLQLAGLDCLIPRKHYHQPEHIDRAMQATLAAIDLAADLGRVPLTVNLPIGEMAADSLSAAVDQAERRGVPLVVHAEDQLDALEGWLETLDLPNIGAGVDPAALLVRSLDPAQVVHRLNRRLLGARLDDVLSDARVPVGKGDLDLVPYRIALDLARARRGPVVLDLRTLSDPAAAARAAARQWDSASPF